MIRSVILNLMFHKTDPDGLIQQDQEILAAYAEDNSSTPNYDLLPDVASESDEKQEEEADFKGYLLLTGIIVMSMGLLMTCVTLCYVWEQNKLRKAEKTIQRRLYTNGTNGGIEETVVLNNRS